MHFTVPGDLAPGCCASRYTAAFNAVLVWQGPACNRSASWASWMSRVGGVIGDAPTSSSVYSELITVLWETFPEWSPTPGASVGAIRPTDYD